MEKENEILEWRLAQLYFEILHNVTVLFKDKYFANLYKKLENYIDKKIFIDGKNKV